MPPTPFLWCGTLRKSSAKGDQGQAASSAAGKERRGARLLRGPSGSLGTVRKSLKQSPDRALQRERCGWLERPRMVAAGRGARLLRGPGGSLGTVRKRLKESPDRGLQRER